MPDCYRHPGRETAVSCSGCGRPICPDCMTPSPVGMRCPECSGDRQRVISARQITDPRLFDVAPVTAVLIAINALVFLAQIFTGSGLSAMSSQISGSVMINGVFFGPSVADGEWWRIVTSGFVHFGFFHIGMNMVLLYMLGRLLEREIGSVRFAAIYAASLAGGALGVILLSPSAPTAGASGAVFGLMSAAFVAQRSRGVDPWDSGIGGLIVLNLLITFLVPGISRGGHLGGLVVGAVISFLLIDLDETRKLFGRSMVPAVVIGVLVTAGLFVLTVVVAQNKFPLIAAG